MTRTSWTLLIALVGCGDPVVDDDGDGVIAAKDCDDGDAEVHPAAVERCNTIDDDCDGAIDEELLTLGYVDADRDRHGDLGHPVRVCDLGPGIVASSDDCDDLDIDVFPGADEVCDGRDQDCDGLVDDDLELFDTWADVDGDGHGDITTGESTCDVGPGRVTNDEDCDDHASAVLPGADEVCNTVDDDCDGRIDEGGLQVEAFVDADADGWGNPIVQVSICPETPGYSPRAGDCDDADPTANPDGTEVCDGADDDCDGVVDQGVAVHWYADIDQDGLGDPWAHVVTCAPPAGYVEVDGDCDDHDAAVPPDCGTTLYGDWPTMGADLGRTGRAIGTVGGATASLAWQTGGGTLSPHIAAASGRVFTSEYSYVDYQWTVHARDLYSGDTLWTSRGFGESGTMTGPTWADGKVCFTFAYYPPESQVACLDEDTGEELWSTLSNGSYDAVFPPLALNGVLYSSGYYTGLYTNDLETGAELFTSGAVAVTGVSAYGDGVYSWYYGLLTAHDPFTGNSDWDLSFDTDYYATVTPAITEDGVAILAGTVDLYAVDLRTQSALWASGSGTAGGAAVAHGIVYVARADGLGRAYDLASGSLVDTYEGDGSLVGPPVITDDAVIFASSTDTYIYELQTGALLQHIDAGGLPSVADNHLLLADAYSGVLRAYAW